MIHLDPTVLQEPALATSAPELPVEKYLVTLKFPEGFQRELDAVRKAVDPTGLRRIPSHVTLVPPFSSASSVTTIAYHLEIACGGFRAFFMLPRGIDATFPKEEVVALRVEPAPHIARLAKHLALQLRPLMEADGRLRVAKLLKRRFRPHVTMARSHLATERRLAADEVARHLANRPAHVTGIELWRLKEGTWQPCTSVRFPR